MWRPGLMIRCRRNAKNLSCAVSEKRRDLVGKGWFSTGFPQMKWHFSTGGEVMWDNVGLQAASFVDWGVSD